MLYTLAFRHPSNVTLTNSLTVPPLIVKDCEGELRKKLTVKGEKMLTKETACEFAEHWLPGMPTISIRSWTIMTTRSS